MPNQDLKSMQFAARICCVVGILLALSTGLSWATTYPLPAGSTQLAIGDFNSDGKLDVAAISCLAESCTSYSGGVALLLNQGNGTFGAAQVISIPIFPDNVVAADFNGDQKLDLAIGGFTASGRVIQILLGNGNGTFQQLPSFSTGCASFFPFVARDFRRDNKPDLLCWDRVTPGLGDGTFGPEIAASTHATLGAGDFNNDGQLDVIVGGGGGKAYLSLGNGDGTFQLAQHLLHTPGGVQRGAVADLNGDGKADAVFSSYVKATKRSFVTTVVGNGDGTVRRVSQVPANSVNVPVLIADYNGDGLLDVISLPDIFLNIGKGKLALPFRAPIAGAPGPYGMAAADLNGDGKADLLVMEQISGGMQLEVVFAP